MHWAEFTQAAPEIAKLAEERFARHDLVLLGTLRKDGSPRISPVEYLIIDGRFYMGMMWRSKKALDLLRDARCVIHSTVSNKDGSEGDVKLYCRAIDIQDAAERQRMREVSLERTGWAPDEPEFHLFAMDIQSAGFVEFVNEKQRTLRWPER